MASSRSARPLAIIAALSAPAEEPATSRIGSPRSTKTAATPASYAPLAPPPESTRAMGASAGVLEGAQVAADDAGAVSTASIATHAARRKRPRRDDRVLDDGLKAGLRGSRLRCRRRPRSGR